MAITAYYSSVLDHPTDRTWELIRDFNSYPAYVDGVTESVIEDDKGGDEIGAVRRFCYLGTWIRQRLVRHSDDARLLTYAGIEPLQFPAELLAPGEAAPSPVRYQGTIRLHRVTDGDKTFLEWPVELDAGADEARWHAQFMDWIPQWAESLRRTLER